MPPMNSADVQGWLRRYIEAWQENDPELVEALFTDDAVYRFRPFAGDGRVAEGVDDIVKSWMDFDEDPSEWEASYETFAVDSDRAVAAGISRYFGKEGEPDEVYHNCFLLRFADGRCAEFTEYWMLEPDKG